VHSHYVDLRQLPHEYTYPIMEKVSLLSNSRIETTIHFTENMEKKNGNNFTNKCQTNHQFRRNTSSQTIMSDEPLVAHTKGEIHNVDSQVQARD
jgi:hypothetical protein